MKLLARWSATATAAVAAAAAQAAAAAAVHAKLKAQAHPGGARRALPTEEGANAAPPVDDTPPRGCGWFESSHELGLGLQVTEHERLDPAGGVLPLDIWLAWHLAGFRADAAAIVASAPAARTSQH